MRANFFSQSLLLAAKDLKIFFNDRGALLFALCFPFVFVVLFSLVMGDMIGGDEERAMTVFVATAEAGENSLSRPIISAITAGETGLDIREADPEKAQAALQEEKIGGYLFFPADFSAKVYSGDETAITVFYNPEASSTWTALTSVARIITANIVSYRITYQTFYRLAAGRTLPGQLQPGNGIPPEAGSPAGSPGEGLGLPPAAQVIPGFSGKSSVQPEVSIVYEKIGEVEPVNAVDIFLPGYLTMFVFFALALTGEAIVGERENYTLERLVAGGASRLSIIGGKYLGSLGRGLIQVAVFWIVGSLIFNVNMGKHPATVIAVSALMALAASGVGVFLATLARSRKGAASMGVFVSLGAAAFGGSWWPLFIMPRWLQNAAKITPHAWANSAFNKLMLFGAAPGDVASEMIALAAFGFLFMTLGVLRFRIE